MFAILLWFAPLAATCAEKGKPTERPDERFPFVSEYMAHTVPAIRFDELPVAGIVDEVDKLARTEGLDKEGYRGLSIARPKADLEKADIETITARLEAGPFVRVVELIANQLGCYIVEAQGIVILMPVDMLDANTTTRAYRLSKKAREVLQITERSAEKQILERLSKFNIRLPEGYARVSGDGKYLIVWTQQAEARLIDALFTFIERDVIGPSSPPPKSAAARSKR